MNPATEPEKRARLVEALAAGPKPNVSRAAREVGYTREHVSRLWNGGDPSLRLEVERRRTAGAVVPQVAAPELPAKSADKLGPAIADGALEAVARLRTILGREPDGETMYASDQVKAAKVLLDLATAPAAKITARSAGPGGQVVEMTQALTPEQLAAAAEKMFGS